jgi:tRNA U34 5-methylaminomethyl-2-thiouridine-forming methyltransferase MnmC/glycine/D-amino acid oxidase-like deaminating enzyme
VERFISADGSHGLYSRRYGESYRSRHGARTESWHVFVAGSGVAARLAAGLPTTVLEIGLGTARNLAGCAAVALAFGTSLRYVALEREVLPAQAWAEQESDALGPPAFRAALLAARAAWDVREGRRCALAFAGVRVELIVGDASALPWPEAVDAVFLDGFSPAVNPELWDPALLARVAASLRPGGTVVSYCVRGNVRRALAAAGLHVERRPGPPGGKRERLWARRPGTADQRSGQAAALAGRRVAVVGAGVAGSSLALAAARAGANVLLVDAGDGTGGASGVPAALVNAYRGRAARAYGDDLLGAAVTWRWAAQLHAAGLDPGAHPVGVVRIADQPRQARAWRGRAGAVAFGPQPHPEAGRWCAPYGGLLVPTGGWIDPRRWLATLRDEATRHGAAWRPGTAVRALVPARGSGWLLVTAGAPRDGRATVGMAAEDGEPFELVALCLGASPPGGLPHEPITAVPGTVAMMPGHAPAHALAGAAYVAPLGSPRHFGLSGRDAWLAVGGGDATVAQDDGERLRATLRRALAKEPPPIHATWRGLRARGHDVQPRIGRLLPGVWWFGSFAGRGFLRAALEAERLVARWAASER